MDEIVNPGAPYIARPERIERQRLYGQRRYLRERKASGTTLTNEQEKRLAELEASIPSRKRRVRTGPDILPFSCSRKAIDRAEAAIHHLHTHRRDGANPWNPHKLFTFTKNMSTYEKLIFTLLIGKEIEFKIRDAPDRHEQNETRHAAGRYGPQTQIELTTQHQLPAAMTRNVGRYGP